MLDVQAFFRRKEMKTEKTYVLINPASRSGYSLKIWKKIRPLFIEAGWEYEVLFSSEEEGFGRITREVTSGSSRTRLLVLGGDGTLNEVFGGIRDFDTVEIGYIPTGSSNDYARAIGLRNEMDAVHKILDGTNPVCRDLGEVVYRDSETGGERKRYFNVSAGMGFDAASCEGVNHSPFKKVFNRLHLGKLIYIAVAVRLILSSELLPFTISVRKEGVTQSIRLARTLFAVCMNHSYEGGGFRFCPDADPEDGRIDLCAASDISRPRFFLLFPKAYDGSHVKYRGITVRQGDEITVETAKPVWLHTDGEVLGTTDYMRTRVLPGKVRFLA